MRLEITSLMTGATNEKSRVLKILRKNSAATPKINFQKKLSLFGCH
jgi:hypothetical protein